VERRRAIMPKCKKIGCKKISSLIYKNGIICSGINKKGNPRFDCVTLCIANHKTSYTFRISPDEALEIIRVLSHSVTIWFRGVYEKKLYSKVNYFKRGCNM